MVMKGETMALGAPEMCDHDDMFPDKEPLKMEVEVLQSAAGYYIGTQCKYCGPYSRESAYYQTKEQAEKDLEEGFWIPRF